MFKDILDKKNNNIELSLSEIEYIVNGYVNEVINDDDMTLFLRSILVNGMSFLETSYLTEVMLKSGDVIDLSIIDGIKVDKHSTGGVGDKTTLILAPLVASCNVKVPKMSGRSLGHTGGTIDKLESIKGFVTDLKFDEFIKQVKEINVAITSQTLNLVPADKKIYHLRDVTNTVSSIPLIASSIMSKKLASGADKILIDVKVGNGALLEKEEDARTLAKYMVEIGKHHNKETRCILTNMDQPLGRNIGNKLEILESIDILSNKGDLELREFIIKLATIMVSMGLEINESDALVLVNEALTSGKAYDKLMELIKWQHGVLDYNIEAKKIGVKANRSGYIKNIDTKRLGQICRVISTKKDMSIDYEVGMVVTYKVGDYINKNDDLVTMYINDIDYNINDIISCFNIVDTKIDKLSNILGTIS